MQIIPVIDLLDGLVVRGDGGDRANYQPVDSVICDSANPVEVTQSLLNFHPFKTIYIADLNALQRQGNSISIIKELLDIFPSTEFWLDAGFSNPEEIQSFPNLKRLLPILASECIRDLSHYEGLRAAFKRRRFILSLDHKGGYLGPEALFSSTNLWPEQVIVMALDDVGKSSGPSLELIASYQALSPATKFVAAGGVRDAQDLTSLSNQGCAALLIASALHSGKISRENLRMF